MMQSNELPCSRCCSPVIIPEETFVKGGVVTCKKCMWNMRIPAHGHPPALQVVDPDSIILRKKPKKREATEAERLAKEQLLVHPEKNPLKRIYTGYQNMNPKPYAKLTDYGGRAVEVGIKFSF